MNDDSDSDSKDSKKSDASPPPFHRRILPFLREHPYMATILLASTVGGGVAGVLLPLGDIPMPRRIIGGAVAGFYFGLFPLGFRLLD